MNRLLDNSTNASDNPLCSATHFLLPKKPFERWPPSQSDALCSQTDAPPETKPRLLHIEEKRNYPSRTPSAISFIRLQSDAGKFDGLYPENAAKKIKIGPGPLALPSFNPTCYQDRTSHLGLD